MAISNINPYLRPTLLNLFLRKQLHQRLNMWSGGTIVAGPFKGLRFGGTSINSAFCPKILGTYERELIPVLRMIEKLHPRKILNIGAGEGYYSVGALYQNWTDKVVCFESESRAKDIITEMAINNNIPSHKLTVMGRCSIADVGRSGAIESGDVVIMDVEGHEILLLDPLRAPALKEAYILVETHDFILEDITSTISERFGGSHAIVELECEERQIEELDIWPDRLVHMLPHYYRMLALSEYRPLGVQMKWLWLSPK